jgi:hypothetical protein
MANTLVELERRRSQLIEEIAKITVDLDNARREVARKQSQLEITTDPRQSLILQQQIERAQSAVESNSQKLARLNQQLAEVNLQIAALRRQGLGPTVSAAQTAAAAQTARDNGANPQNPPLPPQTVDAQGRVERQPSAAIPSNAQPATPPATTNVGTNAPTRPLSSTQSTPPADPNSRAPTSAARPGTGAARDDSSNAVRARIDDIFGGANARIIPQNNVLDKYASYTYNISIYIMSPDNYRQLLQGNRALDNLQLLLSSGGAAQTQRNQFFPLDYYIDDVELISVIQGRGTGGAHNVVELSFKLHEPNGITFLDNLVAATKQYIAAQAGTPPQNYAAQNFLMVIRFYGYDENGNLVTAAGSINQSGNAQSPEAIVEKYIPFQFTGITFKIANNIVAYDCKAVCPQYQIAAGQARGVIPYNIELTSTTLKDLLTGPLRYSTAAQQAVQFNPAAGTVDPAIQNAVNAQNSARTGGNGFLPINPGYLRQLEEDERRREARRLAANGEQEPTSEVTPPVTAGPSIAPAPPNINTISNNTTISGGLAEALNKFQQELVAERNFEYPDIYEIVINEPILQSARVVPPGNSTGKRQSSMGPNPGTAPPKQSKDPRTGSVQNDSKNISATAGMSIVQFIDQVVRTSTYIYDQQTKIFVKDKNGNEVAVPNGIPAANFAWYRIGMQVEPYQYDSKRRDYVYRITYSITPYKVNDVKSDYFPKSPFTGTHKLYNYWFTGENTQVLDYQQDYNYLYYIVVNTEQELPSTLSDYRDIERRAFQPRSNESTHGADGKINEPSSSAASNLYSPTDTARANLTIVGDPAWLQQGEVWSGIQGLNKLYYGPFLEDGTINYESQEILFEIRFNTPADYDIDTGLQNPNRRTV